MSAARAPCLGLLLFLAACPGDVSYIEVELKVDPALPNPFSKVQTIRIEATGPEMSPLSAEAPANERQVWLPPIPVGPDRVITVLGLDSTSLPISRGQSAPFQVTASEPAKVTVPFARCTTIVYRDSDGDGHGNPANGKTACVSKQEGYVDNKTDCDDGDSRAHPGQESYFDTSSAGTQSFDFNCNGTPEPQLTAPVACNKTGGSCTGEGWETTVPACGQEGSFVPCKAGSCTPVTPATTKKQACR